MLMLLKEKILPVAILVGHNTLKPEAERVKRLGYLESESGRIGDLKAAIYSEVVHHSVDVGRGACA